MFCGEERYLARVIWWLNFVIYIIPQGPSKQTSTYLFKTQAIIFIPVIVVFKRLSDATLLNTPLYTQKSCLYYSMCIRSINPCSSELLECKHEVLFAPIHNLQKKLSHLSVLLLFWGHKSILTTVLHPSFICLARKFMV